MNPDERTRKNALAFLDAFAHVAGGQVRPLNYIAISNIQLLELKLGAKDENGRPLIESLSPLQRRDQVNAFVWLQAAPLREVSRGLRRYDALCTEKGSQPEAFAEFMIEVVEPWLEMMPASSLEEAMDQLGRLDEIDAAAVQAEPPPGHKPDRHDPNS